MKTKIRNSISGLFLIPLVLACFALLPSVQATPDPAPRPGLGNVADGNGALASATAASSFNSAVGNNALQHLTTGNNNATQGNSALNTCVDCNTNTAFGVLALRFNVTGDQNTAVGYSALLNNLNEENVAVGWKALASNTSGDKNVAVGKEALFNNTTSGNSSNAVGFRALFSQTTGLFNNGFGWEALFSNVSGSNNTAMGDGAGFSSTGSGNVFLGANAGSSETSANNVICIRDNGDGTNFTASNRTFIGGIRGVTVGNGGGLTVFIDADGQLGTGASARRFKTDIKPMDQASEGILALKPVTFHYKDKDTEAARNEPQFGLIAEDVDAVNPDLVVRNDDGEVYSVRYEAVNVMLLNEFLKEHKKVEAQQASIADLKSTVALQQKGMEVLTAQLKEQAEQIQKVSAQLEVNKPAPRTVSNK